VALHYLENTPRVLQREILLNVLGGLTRAYYPALFMPALQLVSFNMGQRSPEKRTLFR
jgi:hypothetical protein